MKKYIILTTLVCVLYGCSLFEQKRHSGVVAEYKGKTLTYEEVQRQTIGMSTEDSARVAEQYIYQWAINLLEYDVAKDKLNKDIERMVEDYRRSLYIHEYEQYLIAQRMSKEVEDTIIKEFYDLHSHHFVLREAIVKGVLLVVPNGAPNMDLLRKNIQHPEEEENIEWIEKFAYQYAAGYELFLDDWKTVSQIILRMPFEKDDLNKQLKATRQIELQDSINTYLETLKKEYSKYDNLEHYEYSINSSLNKVINNSYIDYKNIDLEALSSISEEEKFTKEDLKASKILASYKILGAICEEE